LEEKVDPFRVGRLEQVGVEAGGEGTLAVVVGGEGDEPDAPTLPSGEGYSGVPKWRSR
jgi:hypothetical protein